MIKAAIFDMDGLLIDSESFWEKSVHDAFTEVGIDLQLADIQLWKGRRLIENVEHLYHDRPWKGRSRQDIVADVVDEVIQLVKSDGRLLPGVEKTLKLIKKQNLPMVLASSSPYELIDTVVDTLKIRDYFEFVYSAESEPYSKPHPGIFISCAVKLGVAPHACLVFEDAPSGVLAAKAAKMYCIAVPDEHAKPHPFIQTADIILDSLEDFDEKLLSSL